MENSAGEKIIPSAPERRQLLVKKMEALGAEGKNCALCTGVCCTFLSNSMQISPLEAEDLKLWLIEQDRWNNTLFDQLKETVRRFRLDQDLGDGRRSFRRTYTCPFYFAGAKGCSISRHHKPYGCLAFNAKSAGMTAGGHCASDQNALIEREQHFTDEERRNRQLKQQYHLVFEKAPIPVALLALRNKPQD